MSPLFDASGSLSLFFQGSKADLRVSRIDVIDYTGFYPNAPVADAAGRRELSL